jgi:hypothetical protein
MDTNLAIAILLLAAVAALSIWATLRDRKKPPDDDITTDDTAW